MLGQLDPAISIMSVLIAVVAAYASLDVLLRAYQLRDVGGNRWREWGPVLMGGSLWAMHVLATLAVEPETWASRAPLTSVLSLAVGLGTAAVLLRANLLSRPTPWKQAAAGLLVGAGFCAMHYIDRSALPAMRPSGDPLQAVLILAAAGAASTLALRLVEQIKEAPAAHAVGLKLKAALLIGLVFSGVQYAALSHVGLEPLHAPSVLIDPQVVGQLLGSLLSMVVLGGCVVTIRAFQLQGGAAAAPPRRARLAPAHGNRDRLAAQLRDVRRQRDALEARLEEARSGYAKVIGELGDGVIVVDDGGRIVEISAAASALFGQPPEQALGQPLTRLLPARYARRRPEVLMRLLRKRREIVGMRADGSHFPVELAISEMALGGRCLHTLVVRDLSERRAEQERVLRLTRMKAISVDIGALVARVRTREELFEEACRIGVEQAGFALAWIALLEPDGQRPVVMQGQEPLLQQVRDATRRHWPENRWPVSTALRENEAVLVTDLRPADSTPPARSLDAVVAAAGATWFIQLPLRLGGDVAAVIGLVACRPGALDAEEMQLLQEITGDLSHAMEFIARRDELDYLASFDSLTRLANGHLFGERIAATLLLARETQQRVAVAMLDVVNFRGVNDAIGHAGGDALLRLLSARLVELSGGAVYVARLGSDRFGLWTVLAEPNTDLALLSQQRVLAALALPFEWEGQSLRLRMRMGAAVYPQDGADAESLVRAAEAALKRAKISGEPLLFATTELSGSFRERMRMENQLAHALLRQEFELHYQPKVDLADGRVIGCEALLRWNRPDGPAVPPTTFIPVLEQTGLIVEVGQWVLQQALADLRRWQEAGRCVRTAINVSPVQLRQPGFVRSVQAMLRGLDGGLAGIDVEVTESMLMVDLDVTIGKLEALRKLGVCVAIDDFGTGYSSLSYLARLPIDTLKVDRSFVVQMPHSHAVHAVVASLIELAHALNLRVVAEGVDDVAQLDLLRRLGCDEIQGWLFSRALPAAQFDALLAEGRALQAK